MLYAGASDKSTHSIEEIRRRSRAENAEPAGALFLDWAAVVAVLNMRQAAVLWVLQKSF